MPKLDQKHKFTLIILAIFIALYYQYKEWGLNDKPLILANTPNQDNLNGIEYLNAVRVDVGLSPFQQNDNLNLSAKNHAEYLAQNDKKMADAHNETEGMPNFTGKTPADRAIFAKYSSNYVLENVSSNQIDLTSSIDNLLTAIYHRFGFLNYAVDEIGFMQNNKIYVYNMGNSILNFICKNGGNLNEDGYYISGICLNKDIKVKKKTFQNATMPTSPKYIAYPKNIHALAYFGEERPDPLPNCNITANPVSIEFNPNLKNIKMKHFKIFDEIKEIQDTILIDKNSDPNSKFNDNQFAIFSKDVFEFNKTYKAEFEYTIDDKSEKIEWEFKTKTPKFNYFVVSADENLGVLADEIYDIFIKPKHCNDTIKKYSYSSSSFLKTKIEYVGLNTIRVFLSGFKGDRTNIKLDNGVSFNIVLLNDSKDMFKIIGLKPINAIILVGLIIVAMIFILNFRRKDGI